MSKRVFFVILFAFVIAGYVLYPKRAQPYNLLFITIDTLRADHLGCYGYQAAQTPNLDQLAANGTLFAQVHSQSPLTLPSHASIFTGTNPTFHKIRDNNLNKLDAKIPTMAEILKENGYRAAAVVSATPLARNRGLAKGFVEYDDVAEQLGTTHTQVHIPEKKAQKSVKAAIAQLQRFAQTPEQPFFLWLHLFDPHAEYQPPPPFRDRFRDNLYDGEIAYTDYWLGKLLQALRKNSQYATTLIVVTADHGEGLGEHGEASHGYFIYNSTLHVPLIFHCPALIPQKHKVAQPVRSIDIMPTTLTLLNIEDFGMAQGKELTPLLSIRRQVSSPKHLPIFAETFFAHYAFGWRFLRSIVIDNYKYIAAKQEELYDLRIDFAEKNNLLAANPSPQLTKRLIKMRHCLRQFVQETEQASQTAMDNPSTLTSLPYLTAPTSLRNEGADPGEMVTVIQMFVKAQTLMWQQRDQQAIRLLEQIVAQDPSNPTCFAFLGKLFLRQQQFDKALQAFTNMYRLRPNLRMARNAVVDVLVQKNTPDALHKARALIDKHLARDVSDAVLWSRSAYLHIATGDFPAAQQAAYTATKCDPLLPSGWFYLGSALQKQQEYIKASDALRRALLIQPVWPQARYQYGECLWESGHTQRARTQWQKLLSTLAPDDPLRAKIDKAIAGK